MKIPTDDYLPIKSFFLSQKAVFFEQFLGTHVYEHAKIDVSLMDDFYRGLCLRLSSYIVTHDYPPEVILGSDVLTYETPASWWQHWKLDKAPKWFKKIWPVKMNKNSRELKVRVDLKRFLVYPDAPPINKKGFGTVVYKHDIEKRVSWIDEVMEK